MNSRPELIECPRDAMQGWSRMIPTADKVRYINSLLRVGFHTIDFGSFVSPKLIPQMADTSEVVKQLDTSGASTHLLAIVANLRGAQDAMKHEMIHYLGFPFSVSETFQMRNANSTREESVERVHEILELCRSNGREMVVYISMGFGNPYGDDYDMEILCHWISKLENLGVSVLSMADTVGIASPEQVSQVVSLVREKFPAMHQGVHLHSTPQGMTHKLSAAYMAGCRRFDGAIGGIGGCPMANDKLVGNMDMLAMVDWFEEHDGNLGLDKDALKYAGRIAAEIFY